MHFVEILTSEDRVHMFKAMLREVARLVVRDGRKVLVVKEKYRCEEWREMERREAEALEGEALGYFKR